MYLQEIIDEFILEFHNKQSKILHIYIDYELYDEFVDSLGLNYGYYPSFQMICYYYGGNAIFPMKDDKYDLIFYTENNRSSAEHKCINIKEYLADKAIAKMLSDA